MGISTFSAWKLRSSGGEDIKQLPVACFELGLTGKYQFSELLGIKAGLEVIGKGEGLELAGTDITGYKGKARINYLIVPVMATVSRSFGDIVVFGQLGPYFGFGLTARKISYDPSKNSVKVNYSESGVSRFDLGCSVGVGAAYPFGPGRLVCDLRYDLGFLDVNNWPDSRDNSNLQAYSNRTFGISVGYLIPLELP